MNFLLFMLEIFITSLYSPRNSWNFLWALFFTGYVWYTLINGTQQCMLSHSHWIGMLKRYCRSVEHATNTGITASQQQVVPLLLCATDSSVIPALSSSRYPQQAAAFAQEGLTATAITAGNIFCKISPTVAWGCVKRCWHKNTFM